MRSIAILLVAIVISGCRRDDDCAGNCARVVRTPAVIAEDLKTLYSGQQVILTPQECADRMVIYRAWELDILRAIAEEHLRETCR